MPTHLCGRRVWIVLEFCLKRYGRRLHGIRNYCSCRQGETGSTSGREKSRVEGWGSENRGERQTELKPGPSVASSGLCASVSVCDEEAHGRPGRQVSSGDETGQKEERAEDPNCESDQQEFLPRWQPLFGILEPIGSVLNSLPRPLIRVSGRRGDPDPDAPASMSTGANGVMSRQEVPHGETQVHVPDVFLSENSQQIVLLQLQARNDSSCRVQLRLACQPVH